MKERLVRNFNVYSMNVKFLNELLIKNHVQISLLGFDRQINYGYWYTVKYSRRSAKNKLSLINGLWLS